MIFSPSVSVQTILVIQRSLISLSVQHGLTFLSSSSTDIDFSNVLPIICYSCYPIWKYCMKQQKYQCFFNLSETVLNCSSCWPDLSNSGCSSLISRRIKHHNLSPLVGWTHDLRVMIEHSMSLIRYTLDHQGLSDHTLVTVTSSY